MFHSVAYVVKVKIIWSSPQVVVNRRAWLGKYTHEPFWSTHQAWHFKTAFLLLLLLLLPAFPNF